MKICKGCGNEHRKSKQVLLVAHDGSVSGARVCLDCDARSIRIVAALRAPVIRQERARTPDDVARVLRMLRTYAALARSTSKVDTADANESWLQRGRAEGYEGAIEAIMRELGAQS